MKFKLSWTLRGQIILATDTCNWTCATELRQQWYLFYCCYDIDSLQATENLAPRVLAAHLKELRELIEKPMDDIKVLPVGDDVTEVLAVITGPASTPFAGGEFRVRLELGPDYPTAPPKGWFLTKIFHPNVGPTGDICVSSLKKDWKPELGMRHTLMAIRCLLICPFAESALNEEAGKLLLEDYDAYARHAALITSIHAKKVPCFALCAVLRL